MKARALYEDFHAGVGISLADALWLRAHGRRSQLAVALAKRPPTPFLVEAPQMFVKRYFDYDLRSYQRGYYFNLFGIIRVLKFNVATVMQKPDYIFIVEIFGREFVIR
jgi:hypothetical protein